jgi:hypothetical protein
LGYTHKIEKRWRNISKAAVRQSGGLVTEQEYGNRIDRMGCMGARL